MHFTIEAVRLGEPFLHAFMNQILAGTEARPLPADHRGRRLETVSKFMSLQKSVPRFVSLLGRKPS
jgi:hypothetical protein